MNMSKLCKECIGYRDHNCGGKNVADVKSGQKPCKSYQFDPTVLAGIGDIEPDDAPPNLKDKVELQTTKRLIPVNLLPTNKTKADNFERLAVQRLTKLLDGFRVLGNLSNKAVYEWIQEQADVMVSRIRSAADSLEKKFEKK